MTFSNYFYDIFLEKRRTEKSYVIDRLEKYKNDPYVFITFTSDFRGHAKFGINPQSHYNTPIGIYSYPLKVYYDTIKNYRDIPFKKELPNIFVFRPKNPDKILFDSKFSLDDLHKYFPDATISTSLDNILKDSEKYQNTISSFVREIANVSHYKEYKKVAPRNNACYEYNNHLYVWTNNMLMGYDNYFKFPKDINSIRNIIDEMIKDGETFMSTAIVQVDQLKPAGFSDSMSTIVVNVTANGKLHTRNKPLGEFILDNFNYTSIIEDYRITQKDFALAYLKYTQHAYDSDETEILNAAYSLFLENSAYNKTPLQSLLTETRKLANENSRKWTIELMKLGIEGVVDDTGSGIIHSNEPFQGVFFKTPELEVLDLIKNNEGKNWNREYSKTDEESRFLSVLDALKTSIVELKLPILRNTGAEQLIKPDFKLKKFVYRCIYYVIKKHIYEHLYANKHHKYAKKYLQVLGEHVPPTFAGVRKFLHIARRTPGQYLMDISRLDLTLTDNEKESLVKFAVILNHIKQLDYYMSNYSSKRFIYSLKDTIVFVINELSTEEGSEFVSAIERYLLESGNSMTIE